MSSQASIVAPRVLLWNSALSPIYAPASSFATSLNVTMLFLRHELRFFFVDSKAMTSGVIDCSGAFCKNDLIRGLLDGSSSGSVGSVVKRRILVLSSDIGLLSAVFFLQALFLAFSKFWAAIACCSRHRIIANLLASICKRRSV